MITKKITFTDFRGNTVTKEYAFHLTKQEVTKMELQEKGGLHTKIDRLSKSNEYGELIQLLTDIILDSYGEISDDGISFMKSKEASDRFFHSNAFDKLFDDFINNQGSIVAFIRGILPDDLQKKISIDHVNTNVIKDHNK